MKYAIEAKGLVKRHGSVRALAGLDLMVPEGSVFGLLGPNGAGKTTALKGLLGLARFDAGTVSVLGGDAADPRRSLELRARVGYASSDMSLFGFLTVDDHIELCRGLYPSWDQGLVQRGLDLFDLPRRRKAGALSRGMRGQLGLILALGPRPALLILDEPTAGLDPLMRRAFLSVLLGEVAARGGTVLMASHQLTEVERTCDRVAIIHRGRAVASGGLDELKLTRKQVRVVLPEGSDINLAALPGVVSVARAGHGFALHVSDGGLGVAEALGRVSGAIVDTEALTLEDIFCTEVGRETP